jgi:AraC-like DNA-binding protein
VKYQPQQSRFLEQMDASGAFYLLFDYLPGVSFFAKTSDFELIFANHAFIERVGVQHEEEIIGKTDFELFPRSLAESFRKDDAWVLQQGQPKLQIIELFVNVDGLPDWYVTNKLPIFGKNREVIGIMGTTQSYLYGKKFIRPYMQIEPAVEFIQNHFREKITIEEVAKTVNLSARQLDRKFQETLKMSPRDFIMKLRLKTACQILTKSSTAIMELALDLGFYDQSSFTLHFRRHMGLTPLQYRKRHQEKAS